MSKVALRVVTNSEMSCFRRCQMEHHYAYVLGYRPLEDAEALRFGACWHLGLEKWWLGYGLDVAIEAATAGAADPYEAARLRVLLRGYEARWGSEPYEVVGVEQEFRAPLINPETGAASRTFQLGGKVDVVIRGGLVEHKTASREIGFGSTYWRKLTMDGQVSAYFAGVRALGIEPERCIYDVVRKPAQRPNQIPLADENGTKIVHDANGERVRTKDGKKWRETGDTAQGYVLQTRLETVEEYEQRLLEDVAASPDKYYQRGEVVRLESEERAHSLDMWLLTQAMKEVTRLGTPCRNTDACERFSRMCSYFPVCSGEASLEDKALFRKLENVHEELSAPEAAE